MKRILVIAGAMLLGACGHREDTRTPAALGTLMLPSSAPWLIVAPGPTTLKVRGLDPSVELAPTPPVASALEAQLRSVVQAAYLPNLTIACESPDVQMRVNADAAPDAATLELAVHCSVNAAGFVSSRSYRATPSVSVKAGSDAPAYASALAALLHAAGQTVGAQLATDVRAGSKR
jgi:hypothetical protein